MDGVVLDVVGRDRAEGAEPDMQGQVGTGDTLGREPAEQFGCKVQPGGRGGGGDRMRPIGIDRLIALPVEGAFLLRAAGGDVGR